MGNAQSSGSPSPDLPQIRKFGSPSPKKNALRNSDKTVEGYNAPGGQQQTNQDREDIMTEFNPRDFTVTAAAGRKNPNRDMTEFNPRDSRTSSIGSCTSRAAAMRNLKQAASPRLSSRFKLGRSNENINVIQHKQPVLGYLLHRSAVLTCVGLPRFGESDDLIEVTDWEDAPKYIFVSHRYLSAEHADDHFFTKHTVVAALLRQMKNVEYLWCDFCCVPADEANRMGAFMNLFSVIMNAVRFLMIPFRSIGPTLAPVFDLREYSNRAWCVLEYSIILARHPSRVRIARILEQHGGTSYKLDFLALPTHDKTLGLDLLIDNMQRVRALLEAGDRGAFLQSFRATAPGDAEIVWDLLQAQRGQIFTMAGKRRNSDFFVRTKFAVQRGAEAPGELLDIYDQATLADMDTRMCAKGPLGVLTSMCGV